MPDNKLLPKIRVAAKETLEKAGAQVKKGRAAVEEEKAQSIQASSSRTYPPQTERWRPLVSKYFEPEDVDKALYVIFGESSGNPNALGDGGSSVGLFQNNMSGGLGRGYTKEQLLDPETNISVAAKAVYGGSGWAPWGEGALYQGKPFGALGSNPYPGPSGDIGGTGTSFEAEYAKALGDLISTQNELERYIAQQFTNEDRLLIQDDASGIVHDLQGGVDPEGTRLFQLFISKQTVLGQIEAARDAGLLQSGDVSADAFRESELLAASEADRAYDNYTGRIQDIVAMEDRPLVRDRALNQDRAAALSQLAERSAGISAGVLPSLSPASLPTGTPQQVTDLSPFVESIKSTLPDSAPEYRPLSQTAISPPVGGGFKLPFSFGLDVGDIETDRANKRDLALAKGVSNIPGTIDTLLEKVLGYLQGVRGETPRSPLGGGGGGSWDIPPSPGGSSFAPRDYSRSQTNTPTLRERRGR